MTMNREFRDVGYDALALIISLRCSQTGEPLQLMDGGRID